MDELELPHGRITLNPTPMARHYHWSLSCDCGDHGDTYTLAEAWYILLRHLATIHHMSC